MHGISWCSWIRWTIKPAFTADALTSAQKLRLCIQQSPCFSMRGHEKRQILKLLLKKEFLRFYFYFPHLFFPRMEEGCRKYTVSDLLLSPLYTLLHTRTNPRHSFFLLNTSHHGTDWAITKTRRAREAFVAFEKAAHCPHDPAADVAVNLQAFYRPWTRPSPALHNNVVSLLHNRMSSAIVDD